MSPHGPERVDELRRRLAEFLERWQHGSDTLSVGRNRPFSAARVKYVGALAAHSFRLGRAVMVMTDAGLGLETAPSVRSLLEHAVTVQWVMAYGDIALWGVTNEEQRQRRNLATSLGKAVLTREAEEARRLIAQVDSEPSPGDAPSNEPARHFEKMCWQLELGDELYLAYRSLSGFSHPTIAVAECYVDDHRGIVLRREPTSTAENSMALLYWAVGGLMWAAEAVDTLDESHPNQDWLAGHSRFLQLPAKLALSEFGEARRRADDAARR